MERNAFEAWEGFASMDPVPLLRSLPHRDLEDWPQLSRELAALLNARRVDLFRSCPEHNAFCSLGPEHRGYPWEEARPFLEAWQARGDPVLWFENPAQDVRLLGAPEGEPETRLVLVRLEGGGELQGILRIADPPAGSEGEVRRALELLRPGLSLWLMESLARSRLARRDRYLAFLHRGGLALMGAREDLLPRLLDQARDLVGAGHVTLFVYDPETGELRLEASTLEEFPYRPRPEGVTATVARTGRPIFVADGRTDPWYADVPPDHRPAALASLPLIWEGRVLGVLNLGLDQPHPFDPEEREALRLFASFAATALWVRQQQARLEDQARRLQTLAEGTVGLLERLDPEWGMREGIALARRLLSADRGLILLRRPGELLHRAWSDGLSRESVERLLDDLLQLPGLREVLRGRAVRSADTWTASEWAPWRPLFRREGVRAFLALPLRRGARVQGALVLLRRDPRAFLDEEVALGRTLAALLTAVVENARLHRRLVEAEKLSALGRLVAGVAHEINNPLTAVLGFGELLREEPLSPEGQRALEEVLSQARRIQEVVSRLLLFAREGAGEKEAVNLGLILTSLAEALRPQVQKAGGTLEVRVDPDLPSVWGNPTQLQELFLQLLQNALQALEGVEGERRLLLEATAERAWVRVRIQDTGVGIPPEDLPRIFEPFFSRRPVGEGAGLGLSIVHGILQEHGGEIRVESVPGEGTTVWVSLPVARLGRTLEKD